MDNLRTFLAAAAALFTAVLSWKRWQATNGSVGQTAVPVIGGTVITTVLARPDLLTDTLPSKVGDFIDEQVDSL